MKHKTATLTPSVSVTCGIHLPPLDQRDYEVNLKAEIEIMALHEKLDQMRNAEMRELIEKKQQQIELLTTLIEGHLKTTESK